MKHPLREQKGLILEPGPPHNFLMLGGGEGEIGGGGATSFEQQQGEATKNMRKQQLTQVGWSELRRTGSRDFQWISITKQGARKR